MPTRAAAVRHGERAPGLRLLRKQLRPQDVLCANLRITDDRKDHKADLVVLLPGAGLVVVEVKGGELLAWDGESGWAEAERWGAGQGRSGRQAREGKYALRSYVESDPRGRPWRPRRSRWAHVVVPRHSRLADDFALPDCPRWSIIDRDQLDGLAGSSGRPRRAGESPRPPTPRHPAIAEILARARAPSARLVAMAAEREDVAQHLTEQQAMILDAIRLLNRVEVRGGAGSGKTWLALEQARRLGRGRAAGRAALLLARARRVPARRVAPAWHRRHRPAYVGHVPRARRAGRARRYRRRQRLLGGALPAQMARLADGAPDGQRFDAVVVDEAQDFADTWWPALLAALRDEDRRPVRRSPTRASGCSPVRAARRSRSSRSCSTTTCATPGRSRETFDPLTPMPDAAARRRRAAVRFVECPADEALERADDEVDAPARGGLAARRTSRCSPPAAVTPSRSARQERGQDEYWESFWDEDQVFYGHVLGFKGLERRAVVLALNERQPRERVP